MAAPVKAALVLLILTVASKLDLFSSSSLRAVPGRSGSFYLLKVFFVIQYDNLFWTLCAPVNLTSKSDGELTLGNVTMCVFRNAPHSVVYN